ncbi:MAG TPA: hypothetical protein PLW81_06625 [Thiobacillaceae bacterium]|nr:hypothetical protein [Thiobacillaceae bacterium]
MDRRHFLAVIPALAIAGCAGTSSEKGAAGAPNFSPAERELIANYYAAARGRSPAKAPAQQAKAGDTLVSGARPAKLPTDLDRQLNSPPAPYTRLTLGADVILVNRDTHQIADVIPQVAY